MLSNIFKKDTRVNKNDVKFSLHLKDKIKGTIGAIF